MRKSERTKCPHERSFSLADFQALVYKAALKSIKENNWDAFWQVVSAVVASREYDAAHAQVGWVIGNLEFILEKTEKSSRPKKTRAQAKVDPRLKRLNAKRNKASKAATKKDPWRGLARIPKNKLADALNKKTKNSK